MTARWFGANLEIHGLKQIVSLQFRRHPWCQVCYRRQPGKYVLNLKFTAYDPMRKFLQSTLERSSLARSIGLVVGMQLRVDRGAY